MMITLDIQEKDGFLIMEDFPENCVFNKVKTGCGATTIALTNDENYIIVVPTTDLVINKCYPTKDKDGKDLVWKKYLKKIYIQHLDIRYYQENYLQQIQM